MRTLAFDGRTGASGDMLLGALLAAGADRDALAPVEAALDVEYAVTTVETGGVSATGVTVRSPDGSPVEGVDDGRRYPAVVDLVEALELPASVETAALGAFERLGRAEAAVHGTSLEGTHFHEVGADDAIADVVGVCLLLETLEVGRVVTTPVRAGGGEVETSHGTYPVPPPAVVHIASDADWTLRGGPVDVELLTPTGAALLAELAAGVDALPPMRVEAAGAGAGERDLGDRPNVLRALVGETEGGLVEEDVVVLETTLDDATPEVLGGLHETLADAGARDVSVQPVTMKKARPGHVVQVVVPPSATDRVARRLALETGTLGVREAGGRHRWVAERRFVTATVLEDGEHHPVRVKLGATDDGVVYDVSAEYDEGAAVGRETGLPVRDVLRRAETAARAGGALDDVLGLVVEADDWPAAGEAAAPPSVETAGGIDLAPVARAVETAAADDPLLVVVDRAAVEEDLRYEERPTGAIARLQGPLPTAAVREAVELPREDGRYVLPAGLLDA